MTKIRRGGYVFWTWKGDHDPPHVHVYLDGRLVVGWDLERDETIGGVARCRVVQIIGELRAKGLL